MSLYEWEKMLIVPLVFGGLVGFYGAGIVLGIREIIRFFKRKWKEKHGIPVDDD